MSAQPDVFHKYLTPAAAESVLSTGKLRWSSPLTFNDPAEFRRMPRFVPSLDMSGSDLISTLIDSAQGIGTIDEERLNRKCRVLLASIRFLAGHGHGRSELIGQLGPLIAQADQPFDARLTEFVEGLTLTTTRILCVTTEADNDRLWQQYADHHRGAVLSFRHLPERSTPLLETKPVEYCEHQPVVGSGLEFLMFGNTPKLRRRCLDGIIYAKRATFQHEREWRVVTWRDSEGAALFGDYPFWPGELAAVTVGRDAAEPWVSRLRTLVTRYPACEFGVER
jgi:hypothetical protein